MSEILKLSSSEVKSWLENETNPIYAPFHMKVRKLRDEMARVLENLADASKMLLESSETELYGRSPYSKAGGLNKLAHLFLERIRRIKVPDQVYYDSFVQFAQETQEALVYTEIDVRNWFPRMSSLFVSERREFLTVFEKAKESLRKIDELLTKEYVKIKTLEETFQLVDELKTLEEQLADLNRQRKKCMDEKALFEKEIVEKRQKLTDSESKGEINQLDQIDMEIEASSIEAKTSLQHLQKPFTKLQSLKLHGEASGLTPEEFDKLEKYVENPLEALTTEEVGYPLLKQILRKLTPLMSSGKLKLKPDKERKAKQAIDKILNMNSLASLHQNSINAIIRKKQLSTSAKLTETKSNLTKLQDNIKELERKVQSIESEEKTTEQVYNKTLKKTRNQKNQIEKNILDFMNRTIHIE